MGENWSSGFTTRSDTNRPVQKQARNLKFRILEEEKLYYPCSENKGTDQLHSYCEADLRLCFRIGIGKYPVFSWRSSFDVGWGLDVYLVGKELVILLFECVVRKMFC